MRASAKFSDAYSVSGLAKSRGETLPDCCLSALLRFHCSQGLSILKAYSETTVPISSKPLVSGRIKFVPSHGVPAWTGAC